MIFDKKAIINSIVAGLITSGIIFLFSSVMGSFEMPKNPEAPTGKESFEKVEDGFLSVLSIYKTVVKDLRTGMQENSAKGFIKTYFLLLTSSTYFVIGFQLLFGKFFREAFDDLWELIPLLCLALADYFFLDWAFGVHILVLGSLLGGLPLILGGLLLILEYFDLIQIPASRKRWFFIHYWIR